MKKLMAAILSASLLLPVLATAQSALDGTWKIDLGKTQLPKKPDVYLLQDGMYECKSCVPPIRIKADGEEHNVTGHPYYDKMSAKITDDRSVTLTRSKNGKKVASETITVAADGSMAHTVFSDSSATNADPVTGTVESTRVAQAPAGSHAISGSWRTSKLAKISDNALTFTYKTQADVLSMTSPTGQSYAAKLDGTYVPYKGDPGTTSVSVKRIDKNTFEETDKLGDKMVNDSRMTVAANGTTMKIVAHDDLHGTTTTFVAEKQ
jgi:hypothetical protein